MLCKEAITLNMVDDALTISMLLRKETTAFSMVDDTLLHTWQYTSRDCTTNFDIALCSYGNF